jgi:hypothetical protein
VSELVEFLMARIYEDENAAKARLGSCNWRRIGRRLVVTTHGVPIARALSAAADHIARHDPARVLAECAAKRAIVERYVWLHENGDTGGREDDLRALAKVYVDHFEFDSSWAV